MTSWDEMKEKRGARRELLTREQIADQVVFGDYWPPGTPELVREFLLTEYDAATMPALSLAENDGVLYLLGWDSRQHRDGKSLLDVVRGHGLTDDEREWVFIGTALKSPSPTIDGSMRYEDEQ